MLLGLLIALLAAIGGYAGGQLAARDAVRPAPTQAVLPTGVLDAAQVAAAVGPAVVAVSGPTGAGSGFLVQVPGADTPVVVTNAHVVATAPEGPGGVQVSFDGADPVDATVLGRDPSVDLAVIAVESAPADALVLRASDPVVGEPVVAIGNALELGRDLSVTSGIISATGRTIQAEDGTELRDLIQTDAAINPGNSGGPLLDSAGQVLGVNTAIINPAISQNVSFAVPADVVAALVANLSRGTRLGVSVEPAASGVVVQQVAPDSAAADAGILTGDVILAIDGTAVTQPAQLVTEISRRSPGDVVQLTVVRQGQESTVQATLKGR